MNGSETILCNLVHVNKKKCRMKTHKLTLHCRNNDILFLRNDKYSKQACYTFKFHPEIKILLKLGCQQTTCITNKTRDAIKQKKYR
jgi:hypothetical protein